MTKDDLLKEMSHYLCEIGKYSAFINYCDKKGYSEKEIDKAFDGECCPHLIKENKKLKEELEAHKKISDGIKELSVSLGTGLRGGFIDTVEPKVFGPVLVVENV